MNRNKKNPDYIRKLVYDQRQEVTRGLLYDHTRINSITAKNIEVSSFLYALIEILNEKGLLTIEDLDEREKQASCMQGNMLQTSFCSLHAGCERRDRKLGIRETLSHRPR
jgi:hypothetical protein